MDRKTYREAFDQIPFSAGFQERTANLLRQRARELEKENKIVNFSKTKKLAVTAAAAVALLIVSVSAAMVWLTPAQVAERHSQPLLAEAFEGPDAIEINETVETGDFAVTLLGLVSGENLDVKNQDVDNAHTYAVLSLRRLDGEPLETQTFDFISYTMTPLVAGFSPTAVNNWTLGAFATGFAEGGVYYYLLDTESIEMFADRTVYMAFYQGGAPSNSIFTMAEDGAISFCGDFDGVHALFTLPLDPSKADPAAAEAFVESTGLTGWSNDRTAGEDGNYVIDEQETEDGKTITLQPKFESGSIADPEGYLAYSHYILAEQERLQAQVDEGALSRENFDEAIREMEENLRGIADGTLAASVGEDGVTAVVRGVE